MTVIEHAYRLRQVLSRPILDNLHAWLVENKGAVMPQSLIGKAINYALGQWRYLYRYIDDGRFAIDNNLIECDIRPFTTGRKAWLFSNSVAGADASAVIYSLMLTCRVRRRAICLLTPYLDRAAAQATRRRCDGPAALQLQQKLAGPLSTDWRVVG